MARWHDELRRDPEEIIQKAESGGPSPEELRKDIQEHAAEVREDVKKK
ncbi:hypothetical protein ACIBFB_26570 [Nocardiopsis sp. NPDC050513]